MNPVTPATVAALLGLGVARALWWAIASGRIDRHGGADDHSADASGSATTTIERPALAGLVLSGADDRICRVLDTAGPATVAHLVAIGAIRVTAFDPDDDAVEFALVATPDELPADAAGGFERRVLDHLRRRSTATASGSAPTVTSGTLWHHPPSAGWWRSARRALTADAVTAGLIRPIVAPVSLAPSLLLGAVAAVIGLVDLVDALVRLDPGALAPAWIVLGLLGVVIATDAARTAAEPPHRLTRAGRVASTLLVHRQNEAARTIDRSSGLVDGGAAPGSPEGVAMAAALGVPTRLSRQAPMPGADSGVVPSARVVWSSAAEGVRPVRVVTLPIPGRGGRPPLVLAVGVGAVAASLILRRSISAVADSSTIESVRTNTPDAVSGLDRLLDSLATLALLPMVLGSVLIVAGAIDVASRRVTSGAVIDVRVPDRRRLVDRLSAATAGIGHDGTILVELAVDDGRSDRIRSWLVDARAAAPVGSTVEVHHTPVLGRVRSIRPLGSAGDAVPDAATVAPASTGDL